MCSYITGPFLGALCVGLVAGLWARQMWGWSFWAGAVPVFVITFMLGLWASWKLLTDKRP